MRVKAIVATLGLVVSLASVQAQNQANADYLTIKNLDSDLVEALEKGDQVLLARLVSDDYLEIDAQGNQKDKSGVLALARARKAASGQTVGPEITVDNFTVRLYQNTAIVSGRTTITYLVVDYQTSSPQTQNPAAVDQERFIRVYAKTGKRWQLISWQTTYLAKR